MILSSLLFVSLVIRVLLFPLQGYKIDSDDFTYWFNHAATGGIRTFYDTVGFADYPPFNVYIFWFFGSIAKAFSASGINLNIVKLTPNLFDLGTALLIFFYVRKQTTFIPALAATALYTFNPAVIFNTAVWGQYDAIYTFFLITSLILAVKSKPELSAVTFAIGILTKPQAIALLPLIVFLIFKKNGAKRLLTSVGAFAGTVFLVILPFQWSNPVTFLSNLYFTGFNYYHYTSINAFNLWGLVGMWVPDNYFSILGWAMFGALAFFVLYTLYKRFKVSVSTEYLAVFAAFMLFFGFFMLPTRIHERYLFPAISVLALLFPLMQKARPLYLALTGTLLVNQGYVLYKLNQYYPNSPNLTGDPVVWVTSVVNLVMFFYALIVMWGELKSKTQLNINQPVKAQAEDEEKADATKIL
jgi:Gpi18-like mannosyltransferase